MEIDHSAAERVKQLEAEVLVYRDALHKISDRLLDVDSWLARIADAIQLAASALKGER
jgi:hypothetical protein